MTQHEIVAQINAKRTAADTYYRLAKITGLSKQLISGILIGRHETTYDKLKRIANAVGLDIITTQNQ